MALVGICPECGYEGMLPRAPGYLREENECPECDHAFTPGDDL